MKRIVFQEFLDQGLVDGERFEVVRVINGAAHWEIGDQGVIDSRKEDGCIMDKNFSDRHFVPSYYKLIKVNVDDFSLGLKSIIKDFTKGG